MSQLSPGECHLLIASTAASAWEAAEAFLQRPPSEIPSHIGLIHEEGSEFINPITMITSSLRIMGWNKEGEVWKGLTHCCMGGENPAPTKGESDPPSEKPLSVRSISTSNRSHSQIIDSAQPFGMSSLPHMSSIPRSQQQSLGWLPFPHIM